MICYAFLKFAVLKTKAEFMFYNRVPKMNSIKTFRSLTGFPWRGRYCPAEIRRSSSPAGRGKKERGMGELRATCLCLRIGLGMAGVGGTAGAGTPREVELASSDGTAREVKGLRLGKLRGVVGNRFKGRRSESGSSMVSSSCR